MRTELDCLVEAGSFGGDWTLCEQTSCIVPCDGDINDDDTVGGAADGGVELLAPLLEPEAWACTGRRRTTAAARRARGKAVSPAAPVDPPELRGHRQDVVGLAHARAGVPARPVWRVRARALLPRQRARHGGHGAPGPAGERGRPDAVVFPVAVQLYESYIISHCRCCYCCCCRGQNKPRNWGKHKGGK